MMLAQLDRIYLPIDLGKLDLIMAYGAETGADRMGKPARLTDLV